MASLADILDILPYEFELFHKPHRLRADPAFRSQRLFRHIINTMSAFACLMDAQRVRSLSILEPDSERLERLSRQMKECLTALRLLLEERLDVDAYVSV